MCLFQFAKNKFYIFAPLSLVVLVARVAPLASCTLCTASYKGTSLATPP